MSIITVSPRRLAEIALEHPEAECRIGAHVCSVCCDGMLYVARIEAAA